MKDSVEKLVSVTAEYICTDRGLRSGRLDLYSDPALTYADRLKATRKHCIFKKESRFAEVYISSDSRVTFTCTACFLLISARL